MNDWLEADTELRLFIRYCRSLPALYDRLRTAEVRYYTCGLKAMPIKSAEEAKYKQSVSCPIDNVTRLLDAKDALSEAYSFRDEYCRRIQAKLMKLSADEVEMLYYRFEMELSLRDMGMLYNLSKNAMQRKLNKVLDKF